MIKKIKLESAPTAGHCWSGEMSQSAFPLTETPDVRDTPTSENKKSCRVCGDKALNVNFNVITCESCKAFFRRNALKQKEFRCPRSESCEVTAESRKSCKKCRLRKCLEVGMMKEWIMTEDERVQKRQLIESNREKRRNMLTGTPSTQERKYGKTPKLDTFDSFSTMSSIASPEELTSESPSLSNGICPPASVKNIQGITSTPNSQADLVLNLASDPLDDDSIMVPKSALLTLIRTCEQNACAQCAPPPVLIHAWRLYDCLHSAGERTTLENNGPLECVCWCVCGARGPQPNTPFGGVDIEKSDMVKMDCDQPSVSDDVAAAATPAFRQMDLNEASQSRMDDDSAVARMGLSIDDPNLQRAQELLVSSRARNGIAGELGYPPVNTGYRHLIDDVAEAVRITQAYIGRIVAMSKLFAPFSALSTSDQIALLQGGIREQLMVQSVINYSHEIDGWLPLGRNQPYEMRFDMFYKFKAEQMEQHSNFLRSFAPQWSSDEILMQAFAALCLFDPNRPGVTDRAAVARQQQFYDEFMREYLLIRYNQDGVRIYSELHARLNWLRLCIGGMQPTYHLELSPTDLSLLMCEILL